MHKSPAAEDAYRILLWSLLIRVAFAGAGMLFMLATYTPSVTITLWFSLPPVLLAFLAVVPWLYRQWGNKYLAFLLTLDLLAMALSVLPNIMLRLAYGIEEANRVLRATVMEPFFLLLIPVVLMAWAFGRKGALWGSTVAVGSRAAVLLLVMYYTGRVDVVIASTSLGQTVLLLVVPLIIAALADRQRRQLRELSIAHDKLQRHAATVEQLAVSRERNRMARDLHDTLAHSLAGLVVHLEAVRATQAHDPAAAQQAVGKAVEMARQGLEESRNAILALRQDPVTSLGLLGAIKGELRALEERTGLHTELKLLGSEPELTGAEAHTFVRIADEALINIERHADASMVWVRLAGTGDRAELMIRDNGKGFDLRSVDADRYGITGMTERAKIIGARLEIHSQPGRGTDVWLVLER